MYYNHHILFFLIIIYSILIIIITIIICFCARIYTDNKQCCVRLLPPVSVVIGNHNNSALYAIKIHNCHVILFHKCFFCVLDLICLASVFCFVWKNTLKQWNMYHCVVWYLIHIGVWRCLESVCGWHSVFGAVQEWTQVGRSLWAD